MIIVSTIFLFVVIVGFVLIRRNMNTLKMLEKDIESRVEMALDQRIDGIDTLHERIANDKEEIDGLVQEIKDVHQDVVARGKTTSSAKLSSKDEMRIDTAEQAVKALRNDLQQSRTHVERILARQSELNRTINGMKQYVDGVVSRIDKQMRVIERTKSAKSNADTVILQNRNLLAALQKAGEDRSAQIAHNARKIASEASRIRRNERDARSTATNASKQLDSARKEIGINRTSVQDVREAAEQNKASVMKVLKDLAAHQTALDANKGAIDANKGAIDANKSTIDANKSTMDSIRVAVEANEKAAATNASKQLDSARKEIGINRTSVQDVREAAEQNKASVMKVLKDLAAHQTALDANKGAIDANKGAIDANKSTIDANKSTMDSIRVAVEANEKAAAANQHAIEGVESRMQSTFKELRNDITAMSDTVSSNQGRVENLWATVTKNRKDSAAALEAHTDRMNERYTKTMQKMEGDKQNILDQLDVLKESFEKALATMSTNNKSVVAKIYETIEEMAESLNKTTDRGIAEIKASMETKNKETVSRINQLTNNILPKTKVDIREDLKNESVEQMRAFKSEINAKMAELRRIVESARTDSKTVDEERESAEAPSDDEDEDDINAPTESRLTVIG